MRISFFGSSLVSAYWNGAATYYRGLLRALAARGHSITFYEPDAFDRQAHRDIEDPEWARVVVYGAQAEAEVLRAVDSASDADLIVKASGVGVHDALLEQAVLDARRPDNLVVFWDVDAPATLERLANNPHGAFTPLVPEYDLILTYGGGQFVVDAYRALGCRECVPIYNALDPDTHYPVPPDARFEAALGFLGNRLPDREARVREFLFEPARRQPDDRFILGGNGWDSNVSLPHNVHALGHIYCRDHNAFNCTPRAVININRDSMASAGFSPPTRIFEAAGAGACLIVDAWDGIEQFLEPGREVLVAHDGEEVARHLRALTHHTSQKIGWAALRRVRAEHTYGHRARKVEAVLEGRQTEEMPA
jgi:spore maturation protein CgeB